jgi:hypothetical protein
MRDRIAWISQPPLYVLLVYPFLIAASLTLAVTLTNFVMRGACHEKAARGMRQRLERSHSAAPVHRRQFGPSGFAERRRVDRHSPLLQCRRGFLGGLAHHHPDGERSARNPCAAAGLGGMATSSWPWETAGPRARTPWPRRRGHATRRRARGRWCSARSIPDQPHPLDCRPVQLVPGHKAQAGALVKSMGRRSARSVIDFSWRPGRPDARFQSSSRGSRSHPARLTQGQVGSEGCG